MQKNDSVAVKKEKQKMERIQLLVTNTMSRVDRLIKTLETERHLNTDVDDTKLLKNKLKTLRLMATDIAQSVQKRKAVEKSSVEFQREPKDASTNVSISKTGSVKEVTSPSAAEDID